MTDIEATDDVDWTPVTLKGPPRVVNVQGGRASLEWELEGGFGGGWQSRWQPTTGNRTGDISYVSGPDPVVRADAVVTWTVPEGAAANAHSYVKRHVETTNDRYREFLRVQQKNLRRIAEKSKENEERRQSLQDELDKLE